MLLSCGFLEEGKGRFVGVLVHPEEIHPEGPAASKGNSYHLISNDRNARTIVPDPMRGPLVKKAFELYATGKHSLADLRKVVHALGLVGKKGKPLSVANIQYFLKNPIYYGLISYNGETYEGTHEPILSKKLFERVQEVMALRGRATRTKSLKPFAFRGLMCCAECGAMITAEIQKGHTYYHCTKRKGPCAQPYVREEALVRQIRENVQKVSLSDDWASPMITELEAERATEAQSSLPFAQNVRDQIARIDEKLDRLLEAYLAGGVTLEEYQIKKGQLVEEKLSLKDRLAHFERKGEDWFEPAIRFVKWTNSNEKIVLEGRSQVPSATGR